MSKSRQRREKPRRLVRQGACWGAEDEAAAAAWVAAAGLVAVAWEVVEGERGRWSAHAEGNEEMVVAAAAAACIDPCRSMSVLTEKCSKKLYTPRSARSPACVDGTAAEVIGRIAVRGVCKGSRSLHVRFEPSNREPRTVANHCDVTWSRAKLHEQPRPIRHWWAPG